MKRVANDFQSCLIKLRQKLMFYWFSPGMTRAIPGPYKYKEEPVAAPNFFHIVCVTFLESLVS